MTGFHEIAALVIFVLVVLATVVLVLWPAAIRLPAAWHHHLPCSSISISYAAAPVAGTLLMLITGVLDGRSFAAGIVGDESMKPYGIVILFMSLAYMSSSLDMTGCFQWVALHLTRMSKGNGLALFLLYYTLSSVLTIFTSNDVSIMALTPIIYYFAAATGADPVPFLTAEFTAANIWSMLLFVGNPTNIIVAMAYRMGFLEYTRWMALPTLAAGFAALAAVLAVHWHHIPRRLQLPALHPAMMLVDKPGAILGSINILCCLGLLAAAPALKWELWLVTLVCALLHALYNFTAYVACRGRWSAVDVGSRTPAHHQDGTAHEQGTVVATPAAAACALKERQLEHTDGAMMGESPQQQQPDGRVAGQLELAEQRERQQQPQSQQAPLPPPQQRQRCPAELPSTAADPRGARAATVSSSGQSAASETDADVCLEDAELSLHSRTCSRQRLLTTQQHAACSSAAELPLQGRGHDPGKAGHCMALEVDRCQKGRHDLDPGGQPAAASAAGACGATGSSSAGATAGLHPPSAPTFWRAFVVLPWEIVPFVLGMFCVVEGLNANGWVDRLAAWLVGGLGGSVWGALFGVGGLSLLLANVINNQPMTILMTRVCMSPAFTQPLAAAAAAAGTGHAAAVPVASALAVVVASNTAANFSIMGALAGIMFVNILRERGMKHFSYLTFSKLMLPAGVLSTVLALVVLGAEFVTWRL